MERAESSPQGGDAAERNFFRRPGALIGFPHDLLSPLRFERPFGLPVLYGSREQMSTCLRRRPAPQIFTNFFPAPSCRRLDKMLYCFQFRF